MTLFAELKRRNVFRVAVLYVVTSWLVLQVADVVIPYFGIPDWTFRFVLVLLALGFVPALVFSWAYEITPEGIKREAEVDRSQSITPVTARRIDVLIAGLLVVLIALVALERFLPPARDSAIQPESATTGEVTEPAAPVARDDGVESTDPRSIAVLPFVNMSADPQQEYFSDGLAESLLHLLAQVQDLRVAARTSSFQFKGHTGKIADIGQALNVAHVLEGSVQRAGDTVRVTAQLIKVDDGYHLWSGTYDRTLDDVFAIQDEIAHRVAEALKVALLGDDQQEARQASTSIEAYDEYLLGLQQLNISSFSALPEALAHFERATELDPTYVPAWVSMAVTWYAMGNTGSVPQQEAEEKMREYANRALELDPGAAQARALLATADFLEHFPAGSGIAESEYRRALELAPRDAFILAEYARYLNYNGDNPLPLLEQALRIDPLAPGLMSRMSLTASRFRQFDLAVEWAKRLRAVYPDNPNATWVMAMTHWQKGELDTAVRHGRGMLAADPSDHEGPASLAAMLLDLGLLEAAQTEVERSESMGPGLPLSVYARMALEYRLGRWESAGEAAIEALEESIDGRHWGPLVMFSIAAEHALRSGRHDRYFSAVAAWTDLPADGTDVEHWADYWDKTAMLPVIRAAGHDDRADAIQANARAFLAKLEPLVAATASRLPLEVDAGNADAAAAEYERLVNTGSYQFWWLQLDPIPELIAGHPRAQAAHEHLKADIARMRESARAIMESDPAPATASR